VGTPGGTSGNFQYGVRTISLQAAVLTGAIATVAKKKEEEEEEGSMAGLDECGKPRLQIN
jgi:hypothetical protein